MGTRNVICVVADGEYKVAQYGQWDGHPEGQGLGCLRFVRDVMDDKFKNKVLGCKYISNAELHKIMTEYGMKEDGRISVDDYDRFSEDHKQLSRDTGSDVLKMIQDSENGICLENEINFIADGLFCEFVYVIDLDKRVFEAYEGFNQNKLSESDRFYFLESRVTDEYHPAKKVGEWSFDQLPSDQEFVKHWRKN